MSKQGKPIVVLLVIAVILAALYSITNPVGGKKSSAPAQKKHKAVKEVSMDDYGAELEEQQPRPQPAKQRPAKKKNKPVAAAASMAMDPAEFAMMADRYGRNDPFSPFFDIQEFTGELINLPDLEPLPPMIMQNPSTMKLSAIVLKSGVGTAIVNGEVLYVGDTIQGFTVSEITFDKVVLLNELKDKAILRLKQEGLPDFNVNNNTISNITDDFMLSKPSQEPSRLIPVTKGGLIIPDDDLTNEITSRKSVIKKKSTLKEMKELMQDDALIDVEQMLSTPENSPR